MHDATSRAFFTRFLPCEVFGHKGATKQKSEQLPEVQVGLNQSKLVKVKRPKPRLAPQTDQFSIKGHSELTGGKRGQNGYDRSNSKTDTIGLTMKVFTNAKTVRKANMEKSENNEVLAENQQQQITLITVAVFIATVSSATVESTSI